MKLTKSLFWDTDYTDIDWEKDAAYVIQRVVMMAKTKDWESILQFYGKEKIKNVVVQLRELDDKTHNFLSHYLNIPKEAFRCYTMKQSFPAPYPY